MTPKNNRQIFKIQPWSKRLIPVHLVTRVNLIFLDMEDMRGNVKTKDAKGY